MKGMCHYQKAFRYLIFAQKKKGERKSRSQMKRCQWLLRALAWELSLFICTFLSWNKCCLDATPNTPTSRQQRMVTTQSSCSTYRKTIGVVHWKKCYNVARSFCLLTSQKLIISPWSIITSVPITQGRNTQKRNTCTKMSIMPCNGNC